jgi:hypothetical protein
MRIAIQTTVLLLTALLASPASADVRLTISNGHVSLSAKDATARQILAEWARVGQTKIVNGERVPGGPLTLELANVSEEQALEVILRAASGYLAAPRATSVANTSRFDRILVLPTSTAAPRAAAAAAPATFPQPQFNPAAQLPIPDEDADDDPPRVVPPNGRGQNPRGPVFPTFPQPNMPAGIGFPVPQPGNAPTAPPPAVPAGVSTPGMVVPAPVQQQPGQFLPPGFPAGFPASAFPPGIQPQPQRTPDRD